MEDYPQNLTEFEARFSSEEACREYLFRLRWPDGFRCPGCGCGKSWPLRKVLLQCAACGRQTSVTAGTIFQDTRSPLPLWFRAMWWVTTQKTGASALGLQRVLGLNRYETVWTWLDKMRRAMVRPGRDLLAGTVEVDESYWGGLEEGLRGRNLKNKALIAVAAQEDGRGIGRIRMKRIEDASGESLLPFVEECIEPGSVVHTDGWPGYSGLKKEGYVHQVTVVSRQEQSASELMPRVHRVMSLLKRWLLGTHQGAVSHKHLDYYLDEFTFRFNRRKSKSRGKLFYRLVQQAVAVDPATYKMIVHPVTEPKKIPKPQDVVCRQMEDYPQNLPEFEARFSSEEACREYLFRLRWPDGFRCPGCGCGKSWPLRKVLLQCAACGRQTSVTAGTIFQDTRSPLPLWFRAMWWVTTQKTGASALGLQRVLGLQQVRNGLDLAAQNAARDGAAGTGFARRDGGSR